MGYASWGVVAVVITSLFCFSLNWHPEYGSHTGVITETGYGGLLFKTHYAKVVSSQFSTDKDAYWSYGFDEQGAASQNSLFEKARELQLSGKAVTIHYDCKFFVWLWEASNNCVITDIKSG